MLIRGHTEQEDVIRTTLYEPRGKFRDRVEGTERMHSDITSSRQLGPHSSHTCWAGYRHWQNKNAWLIAWRNESKTHARGEAVSCQTGVLSDATNAYFLL